MYWLAPVNKHVSEVGGVTRRYQIKVRTGQITDSMELHNSALHVVDDHQFDHSSYVHNLSQATIYLAKMMEVKSLCIATLGCKIPQSYKK